MSNPLSSKPALALGAALGLVIVLGAKPGVAFVVAVLLAADVGAVLIASSVRPSRLTASRVTDI